MTIISSVYVPEGIALSSDSRLTGHIQHEHGIDRFSISDNTQKLVLLRKSTIGVAFCGDAIIDKKTVADFLRVFDIKHVLEKDTVQEVAMKLQRYLLKSYNQYNVHFIVAGYDKDVPFVFDVNKDNCYRANHDEEKGIIYGASWNGESEPVSKLFKDTPFNFDLMPLKDAVDFSEFIAEIAIKYERFADKIPTCGGPIDILVITKDYTDFYKHKIFKP